MGKAVADSPREEVGEAGRPLFGRKGDRGQEAGTGEMGNTQGRESAAVGELPDRPVVSGRQAAPRVAAVVDRPVVATDTQLAPEAAPDNRTEAQGEVVLLDRKEPRGKVGLPDKQAPPEPDRPVPQVSDRPPLPPAGDKEPGSVCGRLGKDLRLPPGSLGLSALSHRRGRRR